MINNNILKGDFDLLEKKKVALIISHRENKKILKKYLDSAYEVITNNFTQEIENIDLIIIDEQGLEEKKDIIMNKKSEKSIYLPLLLITRRPKEEIAVHYLDIIDEIILIPVYKKTLVSRIEKLLSIRSLFLSVQLFQKIMEVNPIGICFLFKDQKIKYVNKAFLDIMEKKRKNVLNENIFEIFPGQNLDKYLNKTKLEKSSNSIKVEIEATDKWVDIRFIETNFNNKKLNALILIDITKSIKQKKEIEYLSYKDKLTDLYNRRFFEEEMERLDTERQLPISVIMADLNGLKLINDSYGHEKGDEVLIKTAEILKETLREEDIVARQGGDEFAILLPKTNSEQLNIIIKRIRDKIEDINSKEDLPLSIALGSATKEKQIEDINEVLKKADNNMYQNKLSESRSSKNKIVKSILNSLSAKSNETTDHAKRMKKLAIRFGSKLKLTYAEINRLSLLASMHDIGKTTISKAILTKADKLSEKEWEIMKNHSKQGYKIASASEEFILIAEDILAHHEHWDGSGYPVGLKGKEIPYLARIISIIDSYDVMINERPYSKAISKEEALKEIKRCAGSQFDPKLAEDFIDMMNANKN